ncbi:MAG: twin-arginine translocation pathway signal protein, partial [Pseudomonadota bacterium]
IESRTPATHLESTRLTRIGAAEVNAQPDGISLAGAPVEAAAATGLISRERMKADGSFASEQVHSFYDALIENTPTYAWLVSPDDSRRTQLDIGRQWVRLNQAANMHGVSFHPVSQVLQEFPQMAAPYRRIHDLLGITPPARIQGLFRFGYADRPEPSPRWPLETRLLDDAR